MKLKTKIYKLTEQLVDTKEAAMLANCKIRTILRWKRDGKLIPVEFESKTMFDPMDILLLVKSKK